MGFAGETEIGLAKEVGKAAAVQGLGFRVKGLGFFRVTLNPKSYTLNPKPLTLNPETKTLNPSEVEAWRFTPAAWAVIVCWPEICTLPPTTTGWGPLVISRVLRALNWVIRTLS